MTARNEPLTVGCPTQHQGSDWCWISRSGVLLAFVFLVSSCSQAPDSSSITKREVFDAVAFTQTALVVDGHIDTPYAIYRDARDVALGDETLEFDYPKAVAGGLDAAFMAVYVPPRMEDDGTATEFANEMIDMVDGFAEDHPDKFAIATCTEDIYRAKDLGLVALPLGIENGAPIAGDLNNLDHFIDRGIRYITLAHSKSNHLADSSYDDLELWGGLSEFGVEVVYHMNDKGVMVDLSHLTDKAAWQVLEITKTPVVATHSSLRHFVPGFHRNMPDELVVAVGESGGVVMINFGSGFVKAESRQWSDTRKEVIESLNFQFPADEAKFLSFSEKYREENPYPFATVEDVVDHIDRVVELGGIDHVGLGSDYEGVGPTMPRDLSDVSKIPIIVEELWSRDYALEDIEKILALNFMRVWNEIEAFALGQGNPVTCVHD